MKKKRLLFGAVDIGYRIETYSKFIKKHYHDVLEVESVSKFRLPTSHFYTEYTYLIPIRELSTWAFYWKSFCFYLKALLRYDLFHFLSGETILPWKLRSFELWTYRLLGKRVIMHFVGSDIRNPQYLKEKNKNLQDFLSGESLNLPPKSDAIQKKLVQTAVKYANEIIVSTPDLLEIIPTATYLPVVLDIETVLPCLENTNQDFQSDKIKILHSPSGFGLKGSDYVHNILEELQEEFREEIELVIPGKNQKNVYSMTRYELLNTMREVDIVIDQLLIGWYGLKSVEALVAGCVVLCYVEHPLVQYLHKDCPIINTNASTLKVDLKNIILNLKENNQRKERIEMNRDFVQKYHTMEAHSSYFDKIWIQA